MSSDQNDYNLRQYHLMQQTISDFDLGKLSLPRLISQIEGLIDALEGVSVEVRNNLLSRWAVLEDIFAVSLHEERNTLKPSETERIRTALVELSELVGSHIDDISPPE